MNPTLVFTMLVCGQLTEVPSVGVPRKTPRTYTIDDDRDGARSRPDDPKRLDARDSRGERSGSPLVEVDVPRARAVAERLVSEIRLPQDRADSRGESRSTTLTLREALSLSPSRRQQTDVAKAYWDVWAAVAHWNHAQDDVRTLTDLQNTLQRGDRNARLPASLSVQLSLADARAQEARANLAEAQSALATRVPRPAPLPADSPHVGTYRTEYTTIFADRNPPPAATRLNATLPLRRTAIELRAEAAQAARQALEQGLANANQPLETTFQRLEESIQARHAFVQSVRAYNRDIADYAAIVAPEGMPADQLSGMLIKPNRGRTSALPNNRTSEIDYGDRSYVRQPSLNPPLTRYVPNSQTNEVTIPGRTVGGSTPITAAPPLRSDRGATPLRVDESDAPLPRRIDVRDTDLRSLPRDASRDALRDDRDGSRGALPDARVGLPARTSASDRLVGHESDESTLRTSPPRFDASRSIPNAATEAGDDEAILRRREGNPVSIMARPKVESSGTSGANDPFRRSQFVTPNDADGIQPTDSSTLRRRTNKPVAEDPFAAPVVRDPNVRTAAAEEETPRRDASELRSAPRRDDRKPAPPVHDDAAEHNGMSNLPPTEPKSIRSNDGRSLGPRTSDPRGDGRSASDLDPRDDNRPPLTRPRTDTRPLSEKNDEIDRDLPRRSIPEYGDDRTPPRRSSTPPREIDARLPRLSEPRLVQGFDPQWSSVDPGQRADKLVQWLGAAYEDAVGSARQISLAEFVEHGPPDEIQRRVAAYWQAWESLARLNLALAARARAAALVAGGDRAAWDPAAKVPAAWRSCKFSADAAVVEAHRNLDDARLKLNHLAGRYPEEPWLLPSTDPAIGVVRLSDSERSRGAAILRSSVQAVPAFNAALEHWASGLVVVDSLRVEQLRELAAGRGSFEQALELSQQEARIGEQFAATLSRYNRAWLDYNRVVRPVGGSSRDFVRALLNPPDA